MNVYAPKNALTKFPAWDFRGRKFKRNGKTWIKAKSRVFNSSWFYCFEDDEIYDDTYP